MVFTSNTSELAGIPMHAGVDVLAAPAYVAPRAGRVVVAYLVDVVEERENIEHTWSAVSAVREGERVAATVFVTNCSHISTLKQEAIMQGLHQESTTILSSQQESMIGIHKRHGRDEHIEHDRRVGETRVNVANADVIDRVGKDGTEEIDVHNGGFELGVIKEDGTVYNENEVSGYDSDIAGTWVDETDIDQFSPFRDGDVFLKEIDLKPRQSKGLHTLGGDDQATGRNEFLADEHSIYVSEVKRVVQSVHTLPNMTDVVLIAEGTGGDTQADLYDVYDLEDDGEEYEEWIGDNEYVDDELYGEEYMEREYAVGNAGEIFELEDGDGDDHDAFTDGDEDMMIDRQCDFHVASGQMGQGQLPSVTSVDDEQKAIESKHAGEGTHSNVVQDDDDDDDDAEQIE